MLVSADPFVAEFDRLAQQVFGTGDGAGMPVDVVRRRDALLIRFDVPGVDRDSIGLTLESQVLTVTAERHARYGDEEKVLVQERFDGTMTRRLRVPDWVDGERVAADCEAGVLTVVLPVAERAKPRRIEIRPGGAADQTSIEASSAEHGRAREAAAAS